MATQESEPSKYFLSTLPKETALRDIVSVAHQYWSIERAYQALKQDFGLAHYEGAAGEVFIAMPS
jgi:SRSO17 transposase